VNRPRPRLGFALLVALFLALLCASAAQPKTAGDPAQLLAMYQSVLLFHASDYPCKWGEGQIVWFGKTPRSPTTISRGTAPGIPKWFAQQVAAAWHPLAG
jgi:hypothetical protein